MLYLLPPSSFALRPPPQHRALRTPASDNSWLVGFAKQVGASKKHCRIYKDGSFDDVLQYAEHVQYVENIQIRRDVIYWLLVECHKRKDMGSARRIRSLMARNELRTDTFLSDHLIRAFAACNGLKEANDQFRQVSKPSVFTWNSIISAHETLGESEKALQLFSEMQANGMQPDRCTFLSTLKACSEKQVVGLIKLLHHYIIETGHEFDVTVMNTLVHTYAKCETIQETFKVFEAMPRKDTVSWAAIITACASCGHGYDALELFRKMQQDGIVANKAIYLALLKVCGLLGVLCHGLIIHDCIIQGVLELDVVIGSSLIDMYGKCGGMEDAKKVFDIFPKGDVILWGSMIAQYADNGQGLCAIALFENMIQQGQRPNRVVFLSLFKACAHIKSLVLARQIHDKYLCSEISLDVVVSTCLVDMYCKCHSVEEGLRIFNNVEEKNLVLWTAMIAGYMQHGFHHQVIKAFDDMCKSGIEPNEFVYSCALKACGNIHSVDQGRLVHEHIRVAGLSLNTTVVAALIQMYMNCKCFTEAQKLFEEIERKDVELWSATILGYAEHGHDFLALDLLEKMQGDSIYIRKSAMLDLLKACCVSDAPGLHPGRWLHGLAIMSGLIDDTAIGNTLLDMYAKCGSLQEAETTFAHLSCPDVISWGMLITGYARHENALLSIKAFKEMHDMNIKPDKIVFLGVLKACVKEQACCEGRFLHEYIIRNGDLDADAFIQSTLIEIYANYEDLRDACKVFKSSTNPDIVLYSQMISVYIEHDDSYLALELIQQMHQGGVEADKVVFLHGLKACANIGAIAQGMLLHDQIVRTGILHDSSVASALIDMYAKNGNLGESHKVFHDVPKKDAASWGAMIYGHALYGNHHDVEESLKTMKKEGLHHNDIIYTTLLSAYNHAGKFEENMKGLAMFSCIEQYGCVVDLLGRTGHVTEATDVAYTMPEPAGNTFWLSLLTSCSTHGKTELGRHCFHAISHMYTNAYKERLLA